MIRAQEKTWALRGRPQSRMAQEPGFGSFWASELYSLFRPLSLIQDVCSRCVQLLFFGFSGPHWTKKNCLGTHMTFLLWRKSSIRIRTRCSGEGSVGKGLNGHAGGSEFRSPHQCKTGMQHTFITQCWGHRGRRVPRAEQPINLSQPVRSSERFSLKN